MAGLDVTHQLLVTPGAGRRRAPPSPGRLAATLGDLFRFFSSTYVGRHDDLPGAAVHDPWAVLALTHPDLFERVPRHVAVETARQPHPRHDRHRPPHAAWSASPNCDVLSRVDADAAWQPHHRRHRPGR